MTAYDLISKATVTRKTGNLQQNSTGETDVQPTSQQTKPRVYNELLSSLNPHTYPYQYPSDAGSGCAGIYHA